MKASSITGESYDQQSSTQKKATHGQNLRYGLRDGQLLSIDEVETGLSCGCRCPSCDTALVAKNREGNKKEAHFAHYKVAQCSGAVESTIHLMAKQVVAEAKQICTPTLTHTTRKGQETLIAPQVIKFDNVLLEASLLNGRIIADVVGTVGKRMLLIEMANTHYVDQHKAAILQSENLACMEIDLRGLDQDYGQLKRFLLEDSSRSKWIHNPKKKILLDRAFESREAKRKEKQQALRKKLEEYKRLGYTIIKSDDNNAFPCPARVSILEEFYQTKYGQHPVVQSIRRNGWWNRKIYGRYEKGSRIFLGNSEVAIWPTEHPDETEISKWRYTFKSVKLLQTLLGILDDYPCAHCRYKYKNIGNTTICSLNVEAKKGPKMFMKYESLSFEDE